MTTTNTYGTRQEEFSNTDSCKNSTSNQAQDNSNRLPMVTDTPATEEATTVVDHEDDDHHYSVPHATSGGGDNFNGGIIIHKNLNGILKSESTKSCHNNTSSGGIRLGKLEKSDSATPYEDHRLGWHQKTRFHVALLGLAIAVVNCYAQATFCIAIVEMVLPSDYVFKGQSSQLVVQNGDLNTTTMTTGSGGSSANDNSCPIEYQYRDYYDAWRFPTSTINSTSIFAMGQSQGNSIDISNRFDWDASRQGLLLGAFAIGTAPLQVLGGRLAEIYGAKWVLWVGCIGTALTNLSIPFLAHFSFILLIVNRVLMGIAQAGMEPGLMCLLAEWLTPTETGFFISMLLFAICIGFFLGSLGSSFLLTLGYGWPITYYVAGGVNLLVAVVWMFYASSRPRDSRVITAGELEFIEHEQAGGSSRKAPDCESDISTDTRTEVPWTKSNSSIPPIADNAGQGGLSHLLSLSQNSTLIHRNNICVTPATTDYQEPDEAGQAPWFNILTTRPVWAFIVCKISIRWCADVLSIELPTYLANVLHLSIKLNGIVNSVSSALFAIFSFLTGYLVNKILQNQEKHQHQQKQVFASDGSLIGLQQRRPGISKTNLRKLMQSFASFGAAISLFLMTRYDCNILFSMSMLLVLSCCLVMGTGGELQIPYDMTSRYPGTLHGMACTLSVSGWLAPPLIGLILGDQPSSRHRWSIVWYMTALINLIGGLVFVLFADASPRDFDQRRPASEQPKAEEHEPPNRRHSSSSSGPILAISKTGYYNVACRSADNSPPSETRRPHHAGPTCGEGPQGPAAAANGVVGWSSHFDSQPIKVRQVEESFIRPYYLKAFDSVAASVVIIPYRTKQLEELPTGQTDNQQQQQQQQPNAVWAPSERVPKPGDSSTNEPTEAEKGSRELSLWSRIWRRRRRRIFCTGNKEIGGGRGAKLIGSAGALEQKPEAAAAAEAPEAHSQMASVEIVISADVLPHCRKLPADNNHPVKDEQQQQQQLQQQQGPEESQPTAPSAAVSMTTTKTITHL